MTAFDRIENMSLVQNGLDHIEFELARQKSSYFPTARESHLTLYRAMIECLRGTANIAVTFKPTGNQEHTYQFDNQPIKKIHKERVPEKAGRNSLWAACLL